MVSEAAPDTAQEDHIKHNTAQDLGHNTCGATTNRLGTGSQAKVVLVCGLKLAGESERGQRRRVRGSEEHKGGRGGHRELRLVTSKMHDFPLSAYREKGVVLLTSIGVHHTEISASARNRILLNNYGFECRSTFNNQSKYFFVYV